MGEEKDKAMAVFVETFLDRGWIRPSKSCWAAQSFLVKKADVSLDVPILKRWR